MSNNRDFKVKNGIQPTSYFEGVGTVVSGSVGYYLEGAAYDSKSFSTATQDTTPSDFAFKSDGSKLFVMGQANETLYQYSLSTSWDISTASYDSVSFLLTSQMTSVISMHFKPDGTKVYLASNAPNDEILQYSLSTAWDLSTISYDSKSFDTSSQSTSPFGLFFKPDGTKMYVQSSAPTDAVFQYSLSTAWDVSTASYDSVTFDVSPQAPAPRSAVFGDSGSKLYMGGLTGDSIYQYSTALNTAELDLSTGSVFEVTPTSDIEVTLSNPADSGTVSGATLLLDGAGTTSYDIANAIYDDVSYSGVQSSTLMVCRFNNDGTKLYSASSGTDDIREHDLSVAYDISTAVYNSVSLDISSQETNIRDMKFKPDGTELFIVGTTSDRVKQYTLSTAWDLSTASYTGQSASVGSQTPEPYSIILNGDGTKLYVGDGANNDRIYGYSLSTAYDVTTLSYDSQNVLFSSQVNALRDMVYNSDGTKLYLLDSTTDSIYQYTLSTAYNPLTLSYDSISFSVSAQSANPTFVEFRPDGTKMYSGGSSTNTVFQYTSSLVATITYDTAIEWPSGTAPTSPAIGETDVVTFNTRDGGSTYQGVLAIDGAK